MARAPTKRRRWRKSPLALVEAFLAALPGEPRLERRQMFGYPCAFVNGNLAVGLHEDRLIARVPDEAARHPCVILGRRMKSYAAIGLADALAPGAMRRWLRRAVAFTATMPPKETRKAKQKARAGEPSPARRARR